MPRFQLRRPFPLRRSVPVGGYAWGVTPGDQGPDWILLPRSDSIEVRTYEANDHLGLFLTFSDLGADPDRLLNFANRFGPLGIEVEVPWAAVGETTIQPARGERLADWQQEVTAMAHAVGVWRYLQSEDEAGLREGSPGPNPIPTAQSWLADTIDQQLQRLGVRPRMGTEPETGKPRLAVAARNLLGGLWLHFAWAVSGDTKYRQCPVCQTYFVIERGQYRESRTFCSDACRMRAYRERKDTARRLAGEGLGLKDIAKRLGSDITTVKGWVARDAL